jgi:hypothetical protein
MKKETIHIKIDPRKMHRVPIGPPTQLHTPEKEKVERIRKQKHKKKVEESEN